jgi:predicted phosphodiesterase
MKYALLGDIHSNLEAFHAVLDDARGQGITQYVCLGDVVGYNADPVACLETIRQMNCICIRGNHDHYCGFDEHLDGFHPLAADVVNWTRQQLTEDQRDFLRKLRFVAPVGNFTIVHSTLDTPDMWGYVFDKLDAEANFTYQNTAVCFYGHTHVPLAFEKTDTIRFGLYSRIKVTLGRKYFINVGSVGQPRDGDPRAAYVVYDMANSLIELRRVKYDIQAAQKKIIDAGLPARVATRLAVGR